MAEGAKKRGSKFYSVYSVFGLFGVTLDFSVVRSGQNASPWSQLFFIFKCVPVSQAGRRGFDPRLPLHQIKDLQMDREEQSPIESIKHQLLSPVHSPLPFGA
jgi:hypothetical protein